MDEQLLIKHEMPNSFEAEQAVIGSMLMKREALQLAADSLVKEDFYYKQYGELFEGMRLLFVSNQKVDAVTLQNKLKEMDVPPELSSMEFVMDVLNAVPTTANVKDYINIVKEKAQLRTLISTNEKIANECYLGNKSVDDLFETTEKEIFKVLSTRGASTNYVPIEDVVVNALNKIETASRMKDDVMGIATGFKDLDDMLDGLQPSDLVLIAARPSMGKTAFVLNLAQHIAVYNSIPTVIFSLEMSKEQLVTRIFALQGGIDAQKFRRGKLSDEEWQKLFEASDEISMSKLILDDESGMSVSKLCSKCRKYKLEHDIQLIIIDYMQLMSGNGDKKNGSRQEEISEISRTLKSLARELNVPVVALSQLSREADKRTDHRPMLSDLRESGAIEQDADVVMFIYRDDYYNHDSEDKGISEIIIAKQRNGPVGTVKLAWLPELTKFQGIEKNYK